MKIVKSHVKMAEESIDGLSQFERPKFTDDLKFPEDITKLSEENVAELLGKYTLLYAYANQERAKVVMRVVELEATLSGVKSELFMQSPELSTGEKWKMQSKLDAEPEVKKLSLLLMKERVKREWLETRVNNYDKLLFALSRELSRRRGEHR